MNTLSLLDVLLLFGVGQGIFLIFSIAQVKNQFHRANKVLVTIILMATIMLVGRVFQFRFQGDWVIRTAFFVDSSIFLFGPLMYLYTRRLLSSKKSQMSPAHFIPLIIYAIYFSCTMCIDISTLSALLSKELRYAFFLTEALGLLSMSTYLALSIRLLLKTTHRQILSESYGVTLKQYLWFFLGSIGALICFWAIGFIKLYILYLSSNYISYTTMWIITPVFFYMVGFFSLKYPEILRKRPSKKRDRLGPNEINELKGKLEELIAEGIYSKPDLTLKSLSEMLGTSPHNLSWLLNHVYSKSFYEFINQLRIDAFKSKIKNNENTQKTLLGLAMEVGFTSKSTFNKAFKLNMNMTPSLYTKKISKNELSF